MGYEGPSAKSDTYVEESDRGPDIARAGTRDERILAVEETGDLRQLEKGDLSEEEAAQMGLAWDDRMKSWLYAHSPFDMPGIERDDERLLDDLRYLREKGFAVSEADVDNPEKFIKAIIPYLAVRNDYRDSDVTEIYNAIEEISNQLGARYPLETLEALFNQIDFTDTHSFQKTRRVLTFIEGFSEIDDEVADAIPVYLSARCGHPENNAFTDMLAYDIWKVAIGAERGIIEMPIAPIGKGLYAAFSFDGDRLQIDQDRDGKIESAIQSQNPSLIWQTHEEMMVEGSTLEEIVACKTQDLDLPNVDYDKLLFFLSEKTQKHLQDILKIDLARELELPELYFAIEQLSKTTVSNLGRIGQFSKKCGLNGFRSFLALNEDESLGNTILELGEKLDEETAKKLFETYAEVIDASETATQEIARIQDKYGNAEIDQMTLRSVAKNIRSRANALLRNAEKKIDKPEQLLSELEEIHASSVMQSELFKGLVRNGELSPEHLDMVPSKETGANISRQDRVEMLKFFERNYAEETEEFRQTVINSFVQALERPDTDFYVLRDKEGHIVAFSRIDQNEDDLYFGSFNVHNMNTQGSGIGSYMLEETLRGAKERAIAEKIPIKAHCDPEAFITQKYIEWGFVATDLVEIGGKPSFELVYDPNQKFQTKHASKEQCAEQAIQTERHGSSSLVYKYPAGEKLNWSLLGTGYVLTRCFNNSEGEKIVVFEYAPQYDVLYEQEAA